MSMPDIRDYQQLVFGGATRAVDCSAWSGAICCHAHTRGAIQLSGRAIRLASSEPIPDSGSPGLNVQQVDAAVYKLTNGKVNFDTPTPGSYGRVTTRDRIVDGRWAHLAVRRATLVNRGYGGSSGFTGSHAITVHVRQADGAPIIGDPLVPYYYSASWDAVLDAAQAVTNLGYIFGSFTRDLTKDWLARVQPRPGAERRVFYRYIVENGRITGRVRHRTEGFSASCTAPRTYSGTYTRPLVRLTEGSRHDWYIHADYAREV
jgi:hypothetical protein